MNDFRSVRRVLWVTMGLNLVATIVKLVVGYATGSLSLVASGFDSVFDSASNIIGLVGVSLAARPADEDHPYGHRKAETMAAMAISSLLFVTTWELIRGAVERLLDPSLVEAEVNIWSFGALLFSLVLNVVVARYELSAGRRFHSDVLVMDAKHTRGDVFVSLSVIVGLVAVRLGFPIADPIIALVIALLIAKTGIDVIRESSPTLMDRVAVPAEQLHATVCAVPGVVSCHKLRSRGHSGAIYVDLHIQVDPDRRTEDTHAIAHEVQYRLRQRFPEIKDVTIHVEPAASDAPASEQPDVSLEIRRAADELGIGIHDERIYVSAGEIYADVHAEADGALSLREAHSLISTLEERARARIPGLIELTAHIEPRGKTTSMPAPQLADADIGEAIRSVAASVLGEGISHHLHVLRADSGYAVTMHSALPGDITLAEAHRISTRLETELRSRVPGLERVVIHTEPVGEDTTGDS
jgi:cation diffusion facilitator family transporter